MEGDRAWLHDILESARRIQDYVRGKSLSDFVTDTQLQDAVIRRFEIIGEAARNVSEETRESLTDLKWREMVGMRNILIHTYREADLQVVWDATQRDIDALITALGRHLHG